MSEEIRVQQYNHPCVLRWNVGDDAYNDGMNLYADGMLEIESGGIGVGKSLRRWFETEQENSSLLARVERLEKALNKIYKVTQFDHPSSQIIGSEEYEGAWLDCIGIAKEALAETEAERE